jgi:hypothetical protein
VGEHHCRKDAIGFEAVQATGDEPLDPIRNQIGRFGVGEKMVIAADLVVAVGEKPLKLVPEQEAAQLAPMRTDTYIGMAFSNLIAFFIILDAGAVLYVHGGRDIRSATQAVEALRPLASEMAFLLFSIGIIRTGLLAVPVLANSAAYALAETLKWPIGLDRKFHRAKGFYGILTLATVLGLGLNFTSIDPINALFWSAVVDGVVAIPIMLTMMLMTANPKVIGTLALPLPQKTNRMDCDLRNVDGDGGNARDLEKLAGNPLGALRKKSPDHASRSRPHRKSISSRTRTTETFKPHSMHRLHRQMCSHGS